MTKLTLKTALGLLIVTGFLNVSCQSSVQKAGSAAEEVKPGSTGATVAAASPSTYNTIIKTDKKKQADLDVPFRGFDPEKQLNSIAIGSCADPEQSQAIWKSIEKNNPNLFIFLGDTLCAPTVDSKKTLSEQYRKMKTVPEFRSVREKIPFMAIWNSYDFGIKPGVTESADKELARTEFIRHWSYLKSALPEKQKALYHSKIFGGGKKQKKVQVIVLDTRWDRTDKQILSREQWNWLEQELKKPADLRFLVSSIQVIPDDHSFDKWGKVPDEREKLFLTLRNAKAKNLIILSGDRHIASLAQLEVKKLGPVYEMTSGSLNRAATPEETLTDKTYFRDAYGQPNFGLILINWDKRTVTLQIKSVDDEVKDSAEGHF